MEELQILLAPDKEYQKVFPNVPIVGFRNGKSLKDHLVRACLPILNSTLGNEQCGKKAARSARSANETFKINKGPLNCNSKKVVYLSEYKKI